MMNQLWLLGRGGGGGEEGRGLQHAELPQQEIKLVPWATMTPYP